jgi:hypothetical protein
MMAQECENWWTMHHESWMAAEKARLAADTGEKARIAAEAALAAAALEATPDSSSARNSFLLSLTTRAPVMSRTSSGAGVTSSDVATPARAVLEIPDSDGEASATADSIPVSPAKRTAPRAFPEVVIPRVRVKKEKDVEPEKVKAKGKKPEFDGPVRAPLPLLISISNPLIGS